MKFAILISLFVFSVSAFAKDGEGGSSVGNGGGGVACAGKPLELLDLLEAREYYGWYPAFNFESSSFVEDHIRNYLSNISFVLGPNHPFVAMLGRETILLRSTIQPTERYLPLSMDYGATKIPDGCEMKQIALRGEGLFEGQLLVHQDFWSSASPSVRALLLIHEASHTWFSQGTWKIDGTIAIRQFVGLLSSDGYLDPYKAELMKRIINKRRPIPFAELERLPRTF